MNRLDVLVGVQPGTSSRNLEPAHWPLSLPPVSGAERPCEVLRRRPDIIAAERRLAASGERIGQATAEYYPKISLAGALGFDSLSGNRLFTSGGFYAAGAGAIRWRLFDFGKVDAEVAQARGANIEALAQYRQAVLRAAEDVENALVTLTQTHVRIGELQNQVQSLTVARDLSEQAYRASLIPLTDVLSANQELLGAQDELDADRAHAARATVGVFRALGGGWDASASF
jgi:outer membrane protein TolC